MFDFFDTSKLLIIGAVALMVIPPKDLPTVLRQLGQAVGKLRRMATEFQGQFNEALKDAEFDSLKKELQELQSSTTMPLDIGTDFNIAAPAPVSEAVSPPADTLAAPHPAPDMPAETAPPAAAPAEPPVAAKPKRRAAKSAPAADKALAEGEAVAKPKRARKPVAKAAADTVIAVNKDGEANV